MVSDAETTAELAALPTLSVPFVALKPLKQPITPIKKPKKIVLIVAGTISKN
jgi:hypothetical protein